MIGYLLMRAIPRNRRRRPASWKRRMVMVGIFAVFMAVGMIAAHSNSQQGAAVDQKIYEQNKHEADEWSKHASPVVPNSKCTVTKTHTVKTGHSASTTNTVKRVCK